MPSAGGNPKESAMIVEGQGMDFWTRVRLPSTPCKRSLKNPLKSRVFGLFDFTVKQKVIKIVIKTFVLKYKRKERLVCMIKKNCEYELVLIACRAVIFLHFFSAHSIIVK